MSNTVIQIKHSLTPGGAPLAASLANGEIALNLADERLYFKNNVGVVKSFSTTGAAAAAAGSNREVQFNDSGSMGSSAQFTFDKITYTLTIGAMTITNTSIIFADGTVQNTAFSLGMVHAISAGYNLI